MRTIIVNAATFGAMYDALNIAYERLVNNNGYGTECPYMAILDDAVARAQEELLNANANTYGIIKKPCPSLSGKDPS